MDDAEFAIYEPPDPMLLEAQMEQERREALAHRVSSSITSRSGAFSQKHFNGGGPDAIRAIAVNEQGALTFYVADPKGLRRRRDHEVTIRADLMEVLYCAFNGDQITRVRAERDEALKEVAKLTRERDNAHELLAAVRKVVCPAEGFGPSAE